MARSIARLEKAGLVRRKQSPTDRRAMIVEATEDSLALRHQVETAWERLENITVGTLSPKRQNELLSRLTDLETNLTTNTHRAVPEHSS